MKKLLIGLVGLSLQASVLVGMEDTTFGKSDWDFNDVVFRVDGVKFHTLGEWEFNKPNGYEEIPFNDGKGVYFDYGTVVGSLRVERLGGQSALDNKLWMLLDGSWEQINGVMVENGQEGKRVDFYITPANWIQGWYAEPMLNSDGKSHGVIEEVPEPGMIWLIGGGLILVGWKKR